MNNKQINIALLKLTRRAETSDPSTLVQTFVDTGMLQALLTSLNHQVIYGRRGTGKTHALIYLKETKRATGDICVYVDMRTVGSAIGLFADDSIPLSERATRLLRDTLSAIHGQLFEVAIENSDSLNLAEVGTQLDAFLDAATETTVTGPVTDEITKNDSAKREETNALTLGATGTKPSISLNESVKGEAATAIQTKVGRSGQLRHTVRFGAMAQTLGSVCKSISPRRLWLLLDEWSAVPMDLQPYLADLLRRCILPINGVSVKIAAIEQRSRFQLPGKDKEYTGIELGADVTVDLNLDDFMVFDHDSEKSVSFFRTLIYNHYRLAVSGDSSVYALSEADFVRIAFTQKNALEEIVRAAEGVPRDAINVVAICAQKAADNPIGVTHARVAAKTWYERDKEAAVSANPLAEALLRWIRDQVIAHRRARAFLLESGTRDPLIDGLFDSRVLHLLKKNISAQEQPGSRYDAYKIDYGCYVDLLSTAKEPQGLLPIGNEDDGIPAGFVDVPPDDYRAIRRAILDLGEFRASSQSLITTGFLNE